MFADGIAPLPPRAQTLYVAWLQCPPSNHGLMFSQMCTYDVFTLSTFFPRLLRLFRMLTLVPLVGA